MSNRHKALGRNRGAYAPGTVYLRGDVVAQAGALYSAKSFLVTTGAFAPADWDLVLAAPVIPTVTAASTGAAKSTVGAGLPGFAGRVAGDLHYDQTTKQEYILTGAAGASASDDFERTGALAGSTTVTGNKTWITRSDPATVANGAVLPTNANTDADCFVSLHTGSPVPMSVEAVGVLTSGSNPQFSLYLNTNATRANGYAVTLTSTGIGVTNSGNGNIVAAEVAIAGLTAGTRRHTVSATTTGTRITVSVDGVERINVPATIGVDAHAGFRVINYGNSGVASIESFSVLAIGTQAWTSTDEYVHTHTHTAIRYAQSTVGAGLPSLAGKVAGDLHYDTTAKKEYVTTGTAGGEASDDFNRANGQLGAAPASTSSSGAVWACVDAQPAGPAIVGNALGAGASTSRVMIQASATAQKTWAVEALWRVQAFTDEVHLFCQGNATGSTSYGAAFTFQNPSTNPQPSRSVMRNLSIISGGSGGSTANSVSIGDVLRLSLTTDANGKVTASSVNTRTGLVAHAPLVVEDGANTVAAGTHVGLRIATGGASTIDDFRGTSIGTLAWESTDEFVSTHTHPDLDKRFVHDYKGAWSGAAIYNNGDIVNHQNILYMANATSGPTQFTDNFNRANGAVGNGWSHGTISNNQLVDTSAGQAANTRPDSYPISVRAAAGAGAVQTVEIDHPVGTMSGGQYTGLGWGIVGTSPEGWYYRWDSPTTIYLRRVGSSNNRTYDTLHTFPGGLSNTSTVVRIKVIFDPVTHRVQMFANDTLFVDVTHFPTGGTEGQFYGVFAYPNTPVDNFASTTGVVPFDPAKFTAVASANIQPPNEVTRSAGLPGTTGRKTGDRHIDALTKRDYVLHSDGVSYTYTDDFNFSGSLTGRTVQSGTPSRLWTRIQGSNDLVGNGSSVQYNNGDTFGSASVGFDTAVVERQVVSTVFKEVGGGSGYGGYAGIYARSLDVTVDVNGSANIGGSQTTVVIAGTTVHSVSPSSGAAYLPWAAGDTLTLIVDGSSVAVSRNGTTFYSGTTPTAAAGRGSVGVRAGTFGSTVALDSFSVTATGTAAARWELAHEHDIPAHTHPSTRYAVNTIGAGLPAFAGRAAADMHYDTTALRAFVLSGLPGTIFTDDFNRADGAIGNSWNSDGIWGTLPSIVNGKASGTSIGLARTIGGAGQSVSGHWEVALPNESAWVAFSLKKAAGNVEGLVLLFNPGTGEARLQHSNSTNTALTNIIPPTTVGSFVGAGLYLVDGSVAADGVTVTYTITHPTQGQRTLSGVWTGASLTNNTAVGFSSAIFGAFSTAVTVDNVSFEVGSTYKWNGLDPLLLSAIVPGAISVANHVVKPGFRMPYATRIRKLVIRTDVALSGGQTTVRATRHNNGVATSDVIVATIADTTNVVGVNVDIATAQGDMWKFDVTEAGGSPTDLLISLEGAG